MHATTDVTRFSPLFFTYSTIAILPYIIICRGLSNDGVGGARDSIFQQLRPAAEFYTGDLVQETLAGLP